MPLAIGRRVAPADRKPVGRVTSHKFRARDFVRKRQNEAVTDHYTIGALLGEGQFGEVFVGTVQQSNGTKGNDRAIKRIQKELLTEEDYDEVFNEFTTLKQMDHPNICKMYEFFEDKDSFWFVQELCSGGELLDELERIETFTEAQAALIMKQVLSCVHYCHSQVGVVHRDLKLENILLEECSRKSSTNGESYNPMIVKVIDFGLATTFTEDQVLTSPVGSMHYIAPEVLECEYGYKCDIWSCGVIAYILLCGYAPFDGGNDREQRELIMMGHVSFNDDVWKNTVSKEAKDFVASLLTYEPENRPDAEEALKHPWIRNASKVHSEQFKANKSGTEAAVRALNNCRSFESASKLKQATCAFMTSQLVLSGREEGEEKSDETTDSNSASAMLMGEIFRAMDLDSDGRLSPEELRLGLLDFLGESAGLTVEEVDDIFSRMDLSFTGYIDYSEFVVAAMGLHDQKQTHHQDLLKQAFQRLLDHDGSGFISREKLRKEMAPFYGEDVEEAIIKKIIDQVDEDKDGQVSWEDFKAMMSKQANFIAPDSAKPLGRKNSGVVEEEKEESKSEKEEEAKVDVTSSTKEDAPVPEKLEEAKTKAPPTQASQLRKSSVVSVAGPKARLISAMFEKNLEKNREFGFDEFQYIQQQPKLQTSQVKNLPRTRRLNFEELTKKASVNIDFDAQAKRERRRKEIEELKAHEGRARDRRATIVTIFQQEKEECRTRRASRMHELESLKNQTCGKGRRMSMNNSTTKETEEQQREQRAAELRELRASIADGSEAKKKLFEMWNKANATLKPQATNRSSVFRELKEFKECLDGPPKLQDYLARRRPALPGAAGNIRPDRTWTKHLSGRSLLREAGVEEAATEASKHSTRPLKRSPSHTALQLQEEQGERLIQMQPNSFPREHAKLIEPLRRLNSFDSDQDNDERDNRLDDIAPEDEPREDSEHPDTEAEILTLPEESDVARPERRRVKSTEDGLKGRTDVARPERRRVQSSEDGLQGSKVPKQPGTVKSASLQFERMHHSFQSPSNRTHSMDENDSSFAKLNKSVSQTGTDREERVRELHFKQDDMDESLQDLEALNNSVASMSTKREARLEELEQLKKDKSGRAKSFAEKFDARANKSFSAIAASDVIPEDGPQKRQPKRHSIAWSVAPEQDEHKAEDKNKTETDQGKNHTESREDGEPADKSQDDEKSDDTNEQSMQGLSLVATSISDDSITSFGSASANNLINHNSQEIRSPTRPRMNFENIQSPTKPRVERPAKRDPNKVFIAPKNLPRFVTPTTPKTKKGRRSSVKSGIAKPSIASRRATVGEAPLSPSSPSQDKAHAKFVKEMALEKTLQIETTEQ